MSLRSRSARVLFVAAGAVARWAARSARSERSERVGDSRRPKNLVPGQGIK